jgi:PAS domain S-box-containing protein
MLASISVPASPTRTKPAIFDWLRNPEATAAAGGSLTPFQQFIVRYDWEASPLGPISSWPTQLCQMVLIIIADPHPAVVYWGDGPTAIIYNEAYTGLIGEKHPSLMGQDPRIGFAELWDNFVPVINRGQFAGETTVQDGGFLLLQRHGFLEETYFSWKFIPIVGDEGMVVGSYATVIEVTREVLLDRRVETAERMSQSLATVQSLSSLWTQILDGLEWNDSDIPLAMVYSMDDVAEAVPSSPSKKIKSMSNRVLLKLEGTLGVPQGHALAPACLDLHDSSHPLAFLLVNALKQARSSVFKIGDGGLSEEYLKGIQWRGFGVPCSEILIVPVRSGQTDTISGALILGLNPRRPYDDNFQTFIKLLTQQMKNPHISTILLQDETRRLRSAADAAVRERAKYSEQLLVRIKSLEQSQVKLSDFADGAEIGLAVLEDTGRTIYGNRAWLDLCEQSLENTHPMSWADSVFEEDRSVVQRAWDRVISRKRPERFEIRFDHQSNLFSSSSRANTPGFEPPYPRSPHFQPQTFVIGYLYPDVDQSGNIKTIMASLSDVSELKWIESQLRVRTREVELSERKWRDFASRAPIGFLVLDSTGFIQFANDRWYELTGHDRNKRDAMSWLQAVHPDDQHKAQEIIASCLEGQSRQWEMRLRRLTPVHVHNGDSKRTETVETHVLGHTFAEMDEDNKVVRMMSWMTEISTQKAAENILKIQMEEAMELKRQQENFIDVR